jgi:phytoene dehydrogenase-like protein
MSRLNRDVVIVGAGPNGLAAAIALAQQGLQVQVIEQAETVGGGVRSAELTRPGFIHDICSAVYPMAVASPFFRKLPLDQHGLQWLHPPIPLAHPLDNGTAAVLERSVDATADRLGADASAYRRLMGPLVDSADTIFQELIGPPRIPRHLITAWRFGRNALRSGRGLAEAHFRTEPAKALIAGLAGHAILPLESRPGAAIALVLGLAGHAVGWPVVAGGAQRLADALASYFRSLGGEIITGQTVDSVKKLSPARAILLDVTPRQLLAMAGDVLPDRYRRRLARYRYGPGIFKLDWALSGPIPWSAPDCRVAGTVHIGGTLEEIAVSESAAWQGRLPERPFILLAQQGVCDPSRAPAGQQAVWAYCHVPHGSTEDMTDRIEAQIERFAPGFRDLILARHAMNTVAMEQYNPNYIGGDIVAGVADLWQVVARPVPSLNPYATPTPGLYLCSASTPPGGGVHGLCGYFAAQAVIRDLHRGRVWQLLS